MKYYRYKYYLNAKHSFDKEGQKIHAHTFAIILSAYDKESEFLSFDFIDQFVEKYFSYFSGRYLNELPEFMHSQTTIEDLGEHFYEALKILFQNHGLVLMQLEIAETPVRSFMISDRILQQTIPYTR